MNEKKITRDMVRELYKLTAEKRAIEKRMDELKKVIAQAAEEENRTSYDFSELRVTITDVTRNGIDETRLKIERPDIASEYAKVTTYKRITVK